MFCFYLWSWAGEMLSSYERGLLLRRAWVLTLVSAQQLTTATAPVPGYPVRRAMTKLWNFPSNLHLHCQLYFYACIHLSLPSPKIYDRIEAGETINFISYDSCVHHFRPVLLHHLLFTRSHSLCCICCIMYISTCVLIWLGSAYEGERQLFFFLRLCGFAWCYYTF